MGNKFNFYGLNLTKKSRSSPSCPIRCIDVLWELSHVTQPLAVSISWQLSAQHTIEGQRGHPATKHRTTSACRIISAALPDLCFPRGLLSLLTQAQWHWCNLGGFICAESSESLLQRRDGNLTPRIQSTVNVLAMPKKLRPFSCLSVCLLLQLHLCAH